MPRFSRLTPETAVGASRDLLGDLVERHGEVGDILTGAFNLVAGLTPGD